MMTRKKVRVLVVPVALLIVMTFTWFNSKEKEILSCQPHEEVRTEMKVPASLLDIYGHITTYVLFIGHARSGHSIVGSLLDAHPEVIISHEQGSRWEQWGGELNPATSRQKYLFYFRIHKNSEYHAFFDRRAPVSFVHQGNGTYIYKVQGQWQGQYRDKITVIGDKMGQLTSEYFKDPANLVKLDYIQNDLGVTLKIIHVIRNPYDIIATQTLRSVGAQRRKNSSPDNKMSKPQISSGHIRSYFARTEVNERIRQMHSVLDLPGHELIAKPRESMRKLCDYVGITCEDAYIEACTKLLYEHPSITRNHVEWSEEQKCLVQQEIEKYPYLRRYTFHSNP